ncbi:hypothetical protein LCY76_09400 [Fictibacillus sp. KIGAM418]|uniref:Conjugal transfer protein n=1 Tax=Fictibacillus marinisediminis TaxID=2878389 RepID=A0A9X2BCC6_9BACL|nr:hypothetical protein [Fictibacillus marinisediminis]MCK6256809.1 hypothetical protein [Fictibacillus marinisediminis]
MDIERNLKRETDRLAQKSCASGNGSGGCYLISGGCLYARKNPGFGRCPYFEKNVLPANPALESEYKRYFGEAAAAGSKIGKCDRCGSSFAKTSNRAKYCGRCRDIERKRKEAARKRGSR